MKKILIIIAVCIVLLSGVGGFTAMYYFNLLPEKSYTAADFDIDIVMSPVDFNGDGTDDYTDFLLGARVDAENSPKYDGRYFADGGYPPADVGVCTDVIWRAFKSAGYCLRDMVDADIQMRLYAYSTITKRDINIDFRRARNLRVFFEEYALSLTTDLSDISEWQAGDIVFFDTDKHVGMISDKRNSKGEPYIIHNAGQPKRDEDYLKRTTRKITGHYRFDASLVDESMLIAWSE